MPTAETSRILSISLEMTILSALTAGGLLAVFRGVRSVAVAADVLRIFVGYRFLQEIFFRTDLGLPGWASADVQAEAFEAMAAEHVAPIAMFIETVILPAMSGWVVVFAVVQTAVGVALLVGWRTRFTGIVAIGYLSTLTVLGFVRLGPLLLASLVVATALGGRNASLDAVSGREPRSLSMPAPSMNHSLVAPAALVLSIVVFTGIAVGIDPSADATPLGLELLVMVGFATIAAAVGLLEATGPNAVRSRPEDGDPVSS
ncbi:hypothetical protein [Halostagnicola bangensis]